MKQVCAVEGKTNIKETQKTEEKEMISAVQRGSTRDKSTFHWRIEPGLSVSSQVCPEWQSGSSLGKAVTTVTWESSRSQGEEDGGVVCMKPTVKQA